MLAALLPIGVGASIALAQTPADPNAAPAETRLPAVEVVGTTPLPGSGIAVDKVPGNVERLTPSDLRRQGSPSLINGLLDRFGDVNINATQDNPFQPDILYRGFEASPVLGTPQGLAVYQNGVRINEPFGDTVNWDLVPDVAIEHVDLVSSNPVFGLNALGGSLVLTMKNAFSYEGSEIELSGGSFGRRGAAFEYGKLAGAFGAYIAGRALEEDGWRQFSSSSLRQLYADLGARGERTTLDLSFTGANNRLFAVGPSPVQELAVGRSLVFTTPQNNFNQLQFVTLGGAFEATPQLSLQANLYRREFRQTVQNGNTTNFVACTPANGLLCQSDGTTPVTDAAGNALPDISSGGTTPIGQNDREFIRSVGTGGVVQTSSTAPIFGRDNNLVLGASLDHADTDFQSTTELGIINSSLLVLPSGLFVFTPQNTGFTATPVSLRATTNYYGLYVTDTFDPTSDLAVTASGRYNLAEIDLTDRLGNNLTGNNRFSRFNPALGIAYKLTPAVTGYAGYSENNRAPTPSEIECSNPTQPCLLPSSLSSDPPLRQVVSHTYELGLRGSFTLPERVPGRFSWKLALYRTDLEDDIFPVASSINTGFFENIGSTRRQGVDAGLDYHDRKWAIFGHYSFVDATFQSPLTIPSPSNPFADADGNIHVRPGNHLPGIPQHRVKLGADYRITENWVIGGTFIYVSDQFFRGDEANQNPQLPGYAVVGLHSNYMIGERFEMFAAVENVLDHRYATFGQFGDPTGVGAPGIPAGAVSNGPGVDNRFVSPAPPIAIFGGVRIRF